MKRFLLTAILFLNILSLTPSAITYAQENSTEEPESLGTDKTALVDVAITSDTRILIPGDWYVCLRQEAATCVQELYNDLIPGTTVNSAFIQSVAFVAIAPQTADE